MPLIKFDIQFWVSWSKVNAHWVNGDVLEGVFKPIAFWSGLVAQQIVTRMPRPLSHAALLNLLSASYLNFSMAPPEEQDSTKKIMVNLLHVSTPTFAFSSDANM